jgi:hypothetical protein
VTSAKKEPLDYVSFRIEIEDPVLTLNHYGNQTIFMETQINGCKAYKDLVYFEAHKKVDELLQTWFKRVDAIKEARKRIKES